MASISGNRWFILFDENKNEKLTSKGSGNLS
jgi:hypothetical protein